MIPQIKLVTGLAETPAVYEIAGHLLLSDAYAGALAAYDVDESAAWLDDPQPEVFEVEDLSVLRSSPITYAGKGWLSNAWRDVECRSSGDSYYLHIPDLASFWIAGDGKRIQLLKANPTCSKDLLAETALGAPLMLALALQDVYSLHVSVVQAGDQTAGQLIAFAGESGQGKTTLARFLSFESGPGWRRIIDDTLPFRLTEAGKVEALPHFPQLKIAGALQPLHLIPPRASLKALYILDTDTEEGGVQIEPLGRGEATLAVVQHTVASRLFDRRLLARHLAFCDAFSAGVPVRRLRYPRRFDHLPLVREALSSDLGLSSLASMRDNRK
jgi:hypothetical protein